MSNVTTPIRIADRLVGEGHPCFVIAEAGVNHNGSLDRALELIDAAASAGADAVKFQTFKADALVTPDAEQAAYQKRNTGNSESQWEMLKRLELSAADHEVLMEHCNHQGVLFMSTPFDGRSAELLRDLGVAVFKLPSGEITNTPLLQHIASMQLPMVVSTGMCNLGEVETAVEALSSAGNEQFVLLHCVSNYPADPADVNLRAMHTMRAAFGHAVGYSDHTLGIEVALGALAMGASVIEKHFTLDRSLPGPDHKASLEPDELAAMMRGIRTIETAMGNGIKRPSAAENETATVARKSLVTATDIPEGTMLTEDLIAIKRPGTGLPPAMKTHLLNRPVANRLPAGHLIRLEDVA